MTTHCLVISNNLRALQRSLWDGLLPHALAHHSFDDPKPSLLDALLNVTAKYSAQPCAR
jgi:hypothetical protein